MRTKLDKLIDQGVEILRKLKAMDRPRLTAKAFFAHACKIAETTPKKVAAFADRLDAAVGVDETRIFIRRMVMAFKSPTYPTPHDNLPKLLRCYGSDAVPGELAIIDGSLALCQAVAAKTAMTRFPEVFGVVEDWSKYQQRYQNLKARLDDLYKKMRGAANAQDFEYDNDGLLPSDQQRGLTRLVFRRAPGVPAAGDLETSDWPRELIADVEAHLPAKVPTSKRHRARISEAAAAV